MRRPDKGGGEFSYVFHVFAVRSLITPCREDGRLFPQDRSPMANRSFLLCQRWLKKVCHSLAVLSISLPAVSTRLQCPGTATVLSSLCHAPNIFLYLPSTFPSPVMYTSLSLLYNAHSATKTRSLHSGPDKGGRHKSEKIFLGIAEVFYG
ncbi:unnamed protein product [Ectocarpus sp. 13 AM-2016]